MNRCPDCGTEVAASLLLCPGCQRLVHADALKRLAAEAERAAGLGHLSAALGSWREAQPLLPPGSRQSAAIAARVEDLVRRVDAGEGKPGPPPADPTSVDPAAAAAPAAQQSMARPASFLGALGAVALLALKFKAVIGQAVVLLLTKGKLLLLGLTKWSTLGSMLVSVGVYWTVFGWPFAIGLVLSIYVHEMGHVMALRRFGVPASAPMFIPGLGAMIRMGSYPISPREDARVGLAGPLWGLGAALVSLGLFLATGWAGFGAIAKIGAWINLFNLMPVWQLDGARGWRALGRGPRWAVVGAVGLAYLLLGDGLLLLIGVVALVRAFGQPPARGDARAAIEYLVLIAALSALCALPVAT